ncbi:MAG: hypothetical protein ACFB2Z_07285 [Maricaulaceae bacterium]
MIRAAVCIALFSVSAPFAQAGEADVVGVRITPQGGDRFRVDATVRHADTGWDHYADLWVVETVNGERLGERVLGHPHVNEQPFTRSLSGVRIPQGVTEVVVKARDSVHGWGGETMTVAVQR